MSQLKKKKAGALMALRVEENSEEVFELLVAISSSTRNSVGELLKNKGSKRVFKMLVHKHHWMAR